MRMLNIHVLSCNIIFESNQETILILIIYYSTLLFLVAATVVALNGKMLTYGYRATQRWRCRHDHGMQTHFHRLTAIPISHLFVEICFQILPQ